MTAMPDFDSLEAALQDPTALREKMQADLLAKHGQQWVDEHRKMIDAHWQQAMALFGYPAETPPQETPAD